MPVERTSGSVCRVSTRDRDQLGRPRSARPRDGAGRPLPHGAHGVERVPEDVVLGPEESLAEAQRLLDAGCPFHAHEVLEGAWKASDGPNRGMWKGLAQLAVGLTHLQRGNTTGAVALLRRGAESIGPRIPDPPHGLDLADLQARATALAERIERDGSITHPHRVDCVAALRFTPVTAPGTPSPRSRG